MHKGYSLSVDTTSNPFAAYVEEGIDFFESTWRKASPDLALLAAGDRLDGDKIMHDWFAPLKANVFISHSHKDTKVAQGLAGYLATELNLRPFVDSLVWGDSNVLLKTLDKLYCRSDTGSTYDYDKRNYSTSHVRMMLAASLTEAIDQCECILFLNTPSSIQVSDAESDAEAKTASPWIYHELNTSRLIRRRPLGRPVFRTKSEQRSIVAMDEAYFPEVIYGAPRAHLGHLTFKDIQRWVTQSLHKGVQSLDVLYALHPAPNGDVPPHK